MHKVLKNLLDFHPLILSGISLVSMICYFVYFGIFIGYFPVLSGSEIFYVGALLFTIVAIFSLFIVSIILLYGWYYVRANNQPTFCNNWLAIILTFPLTLILVKHKQNLLNNTILNFFEGLYDFFNNELIFFVSSFLISFGLLLLLLKVLNCCIKQFAKKTFVVFIVIIGCIFFAENVMKTNGLVQLFLYFLLYMCMLVLIFLFTELVYKDKNPQLFVLAFAVILFIVIFYYWSDDIAKKFEISNIEYKYLSIEKSALGALPENICKGGKYCDDGKTYYDENESNGVVKLYNIKVLSTLGKFYYLEAIGCGNNEKIRFELDANKIISRQK